METPGGILQWERGSKAQKGFGSRHPSAVPVVNPVANPIANNDFPEDPGRCGWTP